MTDIRSEIAQTRREIQSWIRAQPHGAQVIGYAFAVDRRLSCLEVDPTDVESLAATARTVAEFERVKNVARG